MTSRQRVHRSYGTMIVAGHSYPITGVALRNSRFELTAEYVAKANEPELREEPVTVFGEDGLGLTQGGEMSRAAVLRGDRVRLLCTLQIERLV